MKERFQNLEPGDILFVTEEGAKTTIPYLIMYDNRWNLICLACGGITGSFNSKEEFRSKKSISRIRSSEQFWQEIIESKGSSVSKYSSLRSSVSGM